MYAAVQHPFFTTVPDLSQGRYCHSGEVFIPQLIKIISNKHAYRPIPGLGDQSFCEVDNEHCYRLYNLCRLHISEEVRSRIGSAFLLYV